MSTQSSHDQSTIEGRISFLDTIDPSSMSQEQYDELINMFEHQLKSAKMAKRKAMVAQKKQDLLKLLKELDAGLDDHLERKKSRGKEYKSTAPEDEIKRMNYWYKKSLRRLGQMKMEDLLKENADLKRQLNESSTSEKETVMADPIEVSQE